MLVMARPFFTSGQDIGELYMFGSKIGEGNYGTVRTCVALQETSVKLACKTVLYNSLSSPSDLRDIEREVDTMKELSKHKHIVELLGVHRDSSGVHILMELCQGGELFEEVMRRERFPEKEAMDVVFQLASAVDHCHSRRIMHRDIKLENVLLAYPSLGKGKLAGTQPLIVKLTDFGLAVGIKKGQKLTEVAGSPFYMAPEVVRGQAYSFSADIWSLGVILFALLSGLLPFTGPTNEHIFRAVKRGHFDLNSPAWAGVSVAAKKLVRKMLSADPLQRPSAKDILKDPLCRTSYSAYLANVDLKAPNVDTIANVGAPNVDRVAIVSAPNADNEATVDAPNVDPNVNTAANVDALNVDTNANVNKDATVDNDGFLSNSANADSNATRTNNPNLGNGTNREEDPNANVDTEFSFSQTPEIPEFLRRPPDLLLKFREEKERAVGASSLLPNSSIKRHRIRNGSLFFSMKASSVTGDSGKEGEKQRRKGIFRIPNFFRFSSRHSASSLSSVSATSDVALPPPFTPSPPPPSAFAPSRSSFTTSTSSFVPSSSTSSSSPSFHPSLSSPASLAHTPSPLSPSSTPVAASSSIVVSSSSSSSSPSLHPSSLSFPSAASATVFVSQEVYPSLNSRHVEKFASFAPSPSHSPSHSPSPSVSFPSPSAAFKGPSREHGFTSLGRKSPLSPLSPYFNGRKGLASPSKLQR